MMQTGPLDADGPFIEETPSSSRFAEFRKRFVQRRDLCETVALVRDTKLSSGHGRVVR